LDLVLDDGGGVSSVFFDFLLLVLDDGDDGDGVSSSSLDFLLLNGVSISADAFSYLKISLLLAELILESLFALSSAVSF